VSTSSDRVESFVLAVDLDEGAYKTDGVPDKMLVAG